MACYVIVQQNIDCIEYLHNLLLIEYLHFPYIFNIKPLVYGTDKHYSSILMSGFDVYFQEIDRWFPLPQTGKGFGVI